MKMIALETITRLLDFGWTFNDNGEQSYLPLGDKDFDWCRGEINKEELMGILSKKEHQNETIGVGLTWKDTGIGGMLLLFNGGKMSITLSINRKIIDNNQACALTDVNWYLTKLIPPLSQGDMVIESISYYEHV